MSHIDELLSKATGLDQAEVRKVMKEVGEDLKNFPADVQKQQLRDAGWITEPSGTIWLPPKGTVPNRPYERYSAWKRMRELAQ